MALYFYTKQQDSVRDVSRAVDMMDWPRALTVKPAGRPNRAQIT